MKFVIDFIEDVREQIANSELYVVTAALLKQDIVDNTKLVFAGTSPLHSYKLDKNTKQLHFKIDQNLPELTIKDIIPQLLISDMNKMMYELKIDVNNIYKDMEIVGFGKNDEEKKYILFIKI